MINNEITAMTSEFDACGCAVTFRKTCACPKAASMDVTLCPLHASAPRLLEALEAQPYEWCDGSECSHACHICRRQDAIAEAKKE